MAHHRLGHATQARQALDQATELVKHPHPKTNRNWALDLDYTNWLRFHIVRSEAERLVKGTADAPQ
jgi:hypothetical protein